MITVKVCPKCGSDNVRIDADNKSAAVGLSVPAYVCLDCGFSGHVFPEIDKDVPKAVTEGGKEDDRSKENK